MVLSRALALVWRGNSTGRRWGRGIGKASGSNNTNAKGRDDQQPTVSSISPSLRTVHSFHYAWALSGFPASECKWRRSWSKTRAPQRKGLALAFIPGLDSLAVHCEIYSFCHTPMSSCLCSSAVSLEDDTTGYLGGLWSNQD